MLGLAFSRKPGINDEELAIKQFRRGLETTASPRIRYLELHYNLGVLLDKKGRLEEALEQFKLIYQLDVQYRNGEVARRMKQIQEELASDKVTRLPNRGGEH